MTQHEAAQWAVNMAVASALARQVGRDHAEAERGARWQAKQIARAAAYRARYGVKSIQAGPHVAHAPAFG